MNCMNEDGGKFKIVLTIDYGMKDLHGRYLGPTETFTGEFIYPIYETKDWRACDL